MLRPIIALCTALTFLVQARASAQSLPAPPESLAMQPCPLGAEWHRVHGCSVHSTHWVLGSSAENVLLSLAVFGVGYALQLISTAISVTRGREDIGPGYSQVQLNEYEEWGYAPLVGAWAKIALAPPHVDDSTASLFVVEGLIQLLGTVLFVVSLFTHEEEEWTPVAGRIRLSATSEGVGLELPF